MKLLLIRHPKPDVAEGTCYGRTDVPPDADHLRSVIDALRARWRQAGISRPHRLFSSPLQRCARVADAIADQGWPAVQYDDRIAEMDFGHWEGKPWSALPRDEMQAWRQNIATVAPPGGESLAQVALRVQSFARDCLADPLAPDTEVVIVTHVGVIQTMLRVLRGEPMLGFGKTEIRFGSVSTLIRRDGVFEIESCGLDP